MAKPKIITGKGAKLPKVKRMGRKARMECLRLAVQHGRSGDPLETARRFEYYVAGRIDH